MDTNANMEFAVARGMSRTDRVIKRLFDIVASFSGLLVSSPIILLCWIVATIETRSNGMFIQTRIGQYGRVIKVAKIKTMYQTRGDRSPIASSNLAEITKSGAFFRKYKLDELPQLFNVLIGTMSFVGPRPDVPGFADRLEGSDRIVLHMRPGITGPASLKYRDEEDILSAVADPETYNQQVIWPDKVRINKEYYLNYSLRKDLHYILETVL